MVSNDCSTPSAPAERLKSTKISIRAAATFFVVAASLQFLPGVARAASLALGAPNPGQIGEIQGAQVAIPVTVTRGPNDGAGTCTFTGQVLVDAAASTAQEGVDFRLAGGFNDLTLPANPNQDPALDTATIQVNATIVGDTVVEGNEAVAAVLSQDLQRNAGCQLIDEVDNVSPNAVTFTIIEGDPPAQSNPASLELSGNPGQGVNGRLNVTDNDGNLSFSAQLGVVSPTNAEVSPVDVSYSLLIPADVQPGQLNDTVTIIDNAQNQTLVPVTISVVVGEAPTVSEGANLTVNGPAGQSATRTFTVTDDAPGINVAAEIGTVTPTLIDATSGTVTYTFPVPADAAPNQQFNDTITLTDAANNVGTFGVTISTAPEGPGPGSGRIEIEQALVIACQSAPAGSDLAATCAALPAEGTAERAAADSQVKPDELAAQGTMAIEAADGQSQLVGSRLSALRAGSSGLSLSGLNLNLFGQHVPGFVLDSMLPRVGQSGDQSGISTKFGFFVNGNVRIGDKDPSANEPGFDFDAYDATMGLDYRFTPNFVFGGALGYGTAETDFQNDAGDTELDGYKLSFYGTYYTSQAVYVDGIFTFGMNSYDTRRRITFTGVNEDAMGDTDGTEISLSVGGGYDFTRDGFVFGPYGRASYLQLDIDGYRETLTGNTGLALQLDDQEATSITATVGGKAIYNISTTIGVLSPQLNVEYEYEFDDDQRAITGVFVSDPTATQWGFGIDEPDRDVINVGVGGSATLKNGTSGFLFYEQLLGHDDISQFTVTGGFRFEF